MERKEGEVLQAGRTGNENRRDAEDQKTRVELCSGLDESLFCKAGSSGEEAHSEDE